MKEFEKIETEIGYEDPKILVSISMDRGDYEDFEWACHNKHEDPKEVLREIMESIAYADEADELEERRMKSFMSKGVDDKLISLYNQLYRIESKLDKLLNKDTSYVTVSGDTNGSGEGESLPF